MLVDVGSAINKSRLLLALDQEVSAAVAENDQFYSVKLFKVQGNGGPVPLSLCLTDRSEQDWRTSYFEKKSFEGFEMDDEPSKAKEHDSSLENNAGQDDDPVKPDILQVDDLFGQVSSSWFDDSVKPANGHLKTSANN